MQWRHRHSTNNSRWVWTCNCAGRGGRDSAGDSLHRYFLTSSAERSSSLRFPTRLTCYTSGSQWCWRNCSKPSSSGPSQDPDRSLGCGSRTAPSAPAPRLPGRGSSMRPRSARCSVVTTPSPLERSASAAPKLKAPSAWRSSWRRLEAVGRRPEKGESRPDACTSLTVAEVGC